MRRRLVATDMSLKSVSLFCLMICCWILPASSLRCFVCENAKSDEECNKPQNLKECPRDVSPSQDVCEITQYYSKENNLQINKKCGTGPCHVGAANNRVLGWAGQCDKDKPEWKCEFCCSLDACNRSGASSGRFSKMSMAVLVGLPMLVSVFMAAGHRM